MVLLRFASCKYDYRTYYKTQKTKSFMANYQPKTSYFGPLMQFHPMTSIKIESAKKLLVSGVPPKDVAKNLGVSVPTLYRWVPASAHA
jgi:DNA invertase Pin-like site-specific DNA recombinase